MKKIVFAGCITLLLASCGGGDKKAEGKIAAVNGGDGAVASASIDSTKLARDMEALLSTYSSGKMDTVAWQRVADDLGISVQQLLGQTGLDSTYANSKDPAMRAAAVQLKKLRDATGWTPDIMDSLKQAADALKAR
jgi:hypothetical protein